MDKRRRGRIECMNGATDNRDHGVQAKVTREGRRSICNKHKEEKESVKKQLCDPHLSLPSRSDRDASVHQYEYWRMMLLVTLLRPHTLSSSPHHLIPLSGLEKKGNSVSCWYEKSHT